jgi:hypothetical protein
MPYLYNKPYDEKWRKNNKETYNEYQRAFMMRKRLRKRLFDEIKMEFLSILL